MEEPLQDEKLHTSRQDDGEALARRPPVDVAEVGQEKVMILSSAHARKVVMTPHVEDVILELL